MSSERDASAPPPDSGWPSSEPTEAVAATAAYPVYKELLARLLRPNIPALDGIRAISVFLVIFYHLGLELGPPILPGPLGVLAFFVLSGFLITWLLLREEEKYGTISLKGFYKRRTLRIFPAFYVFWLVSILGRVLRGRLVPWPQVLSAFFYVSNYQYAIFRPEPEYMMHTWSLGVEEQFYLLWPLCFLAFRKKPRSLMAGLVVVILAVWIHRIHLWTVFHARDYISYAFDTRVDAILVGCLTAIALKEQIAKRFVDWICRPLWGPLLPLTLIIASVLAEQSSAHWSQPYRLTCGLSLEPLLVAALLCQLIVQSKAGLWSWLNSGPFLYLGKISYPLYLYHGVSSSIAEHFTGVNHKALCISATVIVSILVASGSYYIIEKPFLALKRSKKPLAPRPTPATRES